MQLSELNDKIREEGKLADDLKGLLITEVEGGSGAQDKGIQKGESFVVVSIE